MTNVNSKMDSAISHEHGFRRGFIHGYCDALNHIESGKSLEQMNEHLNTALMQWRESDASLMKVAPAIKRDDNDRGRESSVKVVNPTKPLKN